MCYGRAQAACRRAQGRGALAPGLQPQRRAHVQRAELLGHDDAIGDPGRNTHSDTDGLYAAASVHVRRQSPVRILGVLVVNAVAHVAVQDTEPVAASE